MYTQRYNDTYVTSYHFEKLLAEKLFCFLSNFDEQKKHYYLYYVLFILCYIFLYIHAFCRSSKSSCSSLSSCEEETSWERWTLPKNCDQKKGWNTTNISLSWREVTRFVHISMLFFYLTQLKVFSCWAILYLLHEMKNRRHNCNKIHYYQ
jgi:hypothetical protein